MVATVNAGFKTELITHSDLLQVITPNTPLDNPTSADLNRTQIVDRSTTDSRGRQAAYNSPDDERD
jgi:hypothetical protein